MTEDVVELMASGADVYVATRNADLVPESMFGMGVRPHPDRRTVTVYLPHVSAECTRSNLLDNGEIALTLNRPIDLKSVQLKGRALELRESDETDREFQMLFRASLVEQFSLIGVPRTMTRRLIWWPSLAVTVQVRDVYSQTPGPKAGELLA